MKFLHKPYLYMTFLFAFAQQALLAISSFSIAEAGMAISQGQSAQAIGFIAKFYIYAIVAYILSSACAYYTAMLKNVSWSNYVHATAKLIFNDQAIVSEKNRRQFNNWIAVEAKTTIESCCDCFVGFFSIYLNVSLTIVVFWLAIGKDVVFVLLASMIALYVILFFTKNYISSLANANQKYQLAVMSAVESIWHGAVYGNTKAAILSVNKFDALSKPYFKNNIKTIMVEQLIAATPVVFCVFLILFVLYANLNNSYYYLGAMVALLPRTLQLLGNIHEIGKGNSRLIYLVKRLSNMEKFHSKLDRQDLVSQASHAELVIFNIFNNSIIKLDEFLDNVLNKKLSVGRFLITGGNGSGKSSILRYIKSNNPDSVLLAPGTEENSDISLSSGQGAIEKINNAINFTEDILILDEWDANLDKRNVLEVDKKISQLAKKYLIIEVRHFP